MEAPDPRGLADAARLVRADALGRARRTGPALEILGALSASADPALRSAAGLLAADLLLEADRAEDAHVAYQRWLAEISDGAPEGIARLLRAADAAEAVGDGAAAARALARARVRAPQESPDALRVAMRLALLESPSDARAPALQRGLSSPDPAIVREARTLEIRALLRGDPDREALNRLATLERDGVPRALVPSLRAALRRVVDPWISETASDERCKRVLRIAGPDAVDIARWSRRPAALEAFARCSEQLGLAHAAARLRAVLERDPGAVRTATMLARPGKPAAPLEEGPARAIPSGEPWRALAAAGETARRARAALAD